MNTCDNCKHWDVKDEREGRNRCACKKLVTATWLSIQVDAYDSLVHEYDDGGSFYTGPKFGCLHFEQKA